MTKWLTTDWLLTDYWLTADWLIEDLSQKDEDWVRLTNLCRKDRRCDPLSSYRSKKRLSNKDYTHPDNVGVALSSLLPDVVSREVSGPVDEVQLWMVGGDVSVHGLYRPQGGVTLPGVSPVACLVILVIHLQIENCRKLNWMAAFWLRQEPKESRSMDGWMCDIMH